METALLAAMAAPRLDSKQTERLLGAFYHAQEPGQAGRRCKSCSKPPKGGNYNLWSHVGSCVFQNSKIKLRTIQKLARERLGEAPTQVGTLGYEPQWVHAQRLLTHIIEAEQSFDSIATRGMTLFFKRAYVPRQ